MRYFDSSLTSDASGLQLNLEIAQAVSQRRLGPFSRLFSAVESALRRQVT